MTVPAFLRANLRLLAALLACVLWIVVFEALNAWVLGSPFDVPLKLSPRDRVSQEVSIVVPEYYAVYLQLEARPHGLPGEAFARLVGVPNEKGHDGVKLPIRWTLKTLPEGKLMASGENDVDDHGNGGRFRHLGFIHVPSGHYLLEVEVLRDVPELAPLSVRFSAGSNAKNMRSWQAQAVMLGNLVGTLMVPVALVLVGVLLARAVRVLRAPSRAASG